jgi:hypothetical protein
MHGPWTPLGTRLIQILARADESWTVLIGGTMIISVVERWGKPISWDASQAFRECRVKLVFLGTIVEDYLQESNDSMTWLRDLLGPSPYTSAVFDRFWTMEPTEILDSVETLSNQMSESTISMLSTTDVGNALAEKWASEWLRQLPARKVNPP